MLLSSEAKTLLSKGISRAVQIQKDILLREFRVHYTHTHTEKKITCASEKSQVQPRTTLGTANSDYKPAI